MNKFGLIETGRFFISIRAQYYRKKDSLFVYSLFSVIIDFHKRIFSGILIEICPLVVTKTTR